jgi:hypothetical protein
MIYLPKGSIMQWIDPDNPGVLYFPTEHNRDALSVDNEQIENKQRMINGTMRKWHIASKRTWSTSWTDVPHSSAFTVDGKMGAKDMEDFWRGHTGAFNLKIFDSTGPSVDTLVMFSEFSGSIKKRGRYDFWDLSLSIEEV